MVAASLPPRGCGQDASWGRLGKKKTGWKTPPQGSHGDPFLARNDKKRANVVPFEGREAVVAVVRDLMWSELMKAGMRVEMRVVMGVVEMAMVMVAEEGL